MFACGAEGIYSVVALVPAGAFMDPPEGMAGDEPVMVHMTACKTHLRGVRRHLQEGSPEPVWTLSTEQLLRDWGLIMEPLDLPVFGLMQAV
jgi:hypothetical protein